MCETMSNGAEAKAALAEAKASGKPVWVAWTLKDADATSATLFGNQSLQEVLLLTCRMDLLLNIEFECVRVRSVGYETCDVSVKEVVNENQIWLIASESLFSLVSTRAYPIQQSTLPPQTACLTNYPTHEPNNCPGPLCGQHKGNTCISPVCTARMTLGYVDISSKHISSLCVHRHSNKFRNCNQML